MPNAFNALIIALIAILVAYTAADLAHENDCRAAQDALHTITVNANLFTSEAELQRAAAPHIEFFTTQCTK